MFCDDFPAYLCSMWKYPGGTFPSVRRSLRPAAEGRIPSGKVKNESSMTYYTPQSGMHFKSSTSSLYFSAFTFSRKFRQTASNVSHADFSLSVNRCSNRSSLMMSRICGPVKMPSLNFTSLSFGNFSPKH